MDKNLKEIDSGITVRKKNYNFDGVRRYWLADRPFHTHFWNMMNILFPTGEDFFIRSVQKYKERVKDPVLLQQVKNFSAQEMQHSIQHGHFLENLDQFGYRYKGILRVMDLGINKLLPFALLRLSITAACEHFTAAFSRVLLNRIFVHLSPIDPRMKELYEWHAAEELEHKSVAFDVLKIVNDSYLLRVSGMIMGVTLFFPTLFFGIFALLFQDRVLFRISTLRDFFEFTFGRFKFLSITLREILIYFRPGFHPEQTDDLNLARDVFERHEAAVL